MPWHITKSAQCPAQKPWAVVKDADGTVAGCHASQAKAHKQMAALYANEPGGMMSNDQTPLPRDNLVRAIFPADTELREETGGMPTLTGHFAVFDEWTEIKSSYEGNFLERIAPGAFKKTFQEQTPKVLFQHGRDPQIGDKVLGIPSLLEEDGQGARYEVPLLDTAYNRDLIPGLKAGGYGASFRFQVMKEHVDQEPGESDWNPKGLPERTIQEARVAELGPVTFPAYPGATAGIRSLTDEFLPGGRYALGPDGHAEPVETPEQQFAQIRDELQPTTVEGEPTHSPDAAAVKTLVDAGLSPEDLVDAVVSRDTPPAEEVASTIEHAEELRALSDSIDQMRARQGEIKRELAEIAIEHSGQVLSAQDQARWDALDQEWQELADGCAAEERRQARLAEIADRGDDSRETLVTGTGTYVTHRQGRDKGPDDPFDLTRYHSLARDQEHMHRLQKEGARRAIETFSYPHPDADRATVNAHIEKILAQDSPDGEIAQRILATGSRTYKRAFAKQFSGQPLTNDEARALGVATAAQGQVAVPIDLDPTLIPTSNMHLNPLRRISRVVTTTSYQWQGVLSAGITASYAAEAAVSSDNAPTLGGYPITPARAQAFVPFSYEIGQDWGSLESNIASELQEAKDFLEAQKFTTGSATNEPQGLLVGASTITASVTASTLFGAADLYTLENALPARHLANASWLGHPSMYSRVRQLDTGGGGNLWVQLAAPNPPTLLGYPAYKITTFGTSVPTTSGRYAVFGDFQKFVIVDRVGMSIKLIPDVFSGSGNTVFPTGVSGFYCFWRNSSAVIDANAFRVGTIAQA